MGSSASCNCVGVVKAVMSGAIPRDSGAVVVTILCDSGMRHLSKFHNREYLKSMELLPPYLDCDDEHGTAACDAPRSVWDFVSL